MQLIHTQNQDFYPRSPCGERLEIFCECFGRPKFLSTLSLRRATDRIFANKHGVSISIHALLAESDIILCNVDQLFDISIHALLAESDGVTFDSRQRVLAFLSTLSLRRATFFPHTQSPSQCPFLSTLSLRRATSFPKSCGKPYLFLSTLSLRRATYVVVDGAGIHAFLSTLSLRRATALHCPRHYPGSISIHALLAESDIAASVFLRSCIAFLSTLSLRRATDRHKTGRVHNGYFYPRSPCGERHRQQFARAAGALFLSTLSLRRATRQRGLAGGALPISIHALLAESDSNTGFVTAPIARFLSTLSLRRATQSRRRGNTIRSISIHALLAESDIILCNVDQLFDISIHALLAESDGSSASAWTMASNFYPRSPCGERPATTWSGWWSTTYFYPRSPCGERQNVVPDRIEILYFYPRSPCGERLPYCAAVLILFVFLSTLSLRRATSA